MKITKRQLRRIIKEAVDSSALWNITDEMADMLEREYDKQGGNVRYPYGRYRGDVRSSHSYTRKDGKPVQPEDIAIFEKLSAEQKKDPYIAMSGVYSYKVSDDGMTLTVNYYRHTAG